ncbi:unnamed protein product [Cercospora beticola]|nr:unnamed protein product [Cercospora beticola]
MMSNVSCLLSSASQCASKIALLDPLFVCHHQFGLQPATALQDERHASTQCRWAEIFSAELYQTSRLCSSKIATMCAVSEADAYVGARPTNAFTSWCTGEIAVVRSAAGALSPRCPMLREHFSRHSLKAEQAVRARVGGG